MDFFTHQDIARRKTKLLVLYYFIAVALIMVAVYLAIAVPINIFMADEIENFYDTNILIALWVLLGTSAVVFFGSLYKMSSLGAGGVAVARMLGGRKIDRNSANVDEIKVLNVVEEMAIASGISCPPVYLLAEDTSINAFAAGFSPQDAVVGVTRGCVEKLSRDELQGVVAHEFSHILNGDMRLNIRLMGVLHGILCVALIGYGVFRVGLQFAGSSSTSSRSRSSGKGNNGGAAMGIALIGLLVMAVGYIGVFFAKLIKSAVSRQREFLADAAAVQFTRNPTGIAGALARIAGYSRGSCLSSTHAEEASHMFFANGLTSSFLNMMSTHPPLDERIRRIDPSFPLQLTVSSDSEGRGGADSAAAGFAAGFAGGVPGGAAAVAPGLSSAPAGLAGRETRVGSAAAVVAQIGAPDRAHLDYATKIIGEIPEPLGNAAHGTDGAQAVVYCLLLSDELEAKGAQVARVNTHAAAVVIEAMNNIMPSLSRIGVEHRLPLLDMAVASLKEMEPGRYREFIDNVDALVAADNQVSLFEYAVKRVIHRELAPIFGGGGKTAIKYYGFNPELSRQCATLLGSLASWGAESAEEAAAMFAAGAAEIAAKPPLAMPAAGQGGLAAVDAALRVLAATSPTLKRQIIAACVATIAANGKVNPAEAETLRAVAAALDCPMPPFLPGQTLAA